MAFTTDDIGALDRALAAGVQSVRFADGRTVNYQTPAEMIQVRNLIQQELAMTSATPPSRITRVVFVRE